MTNSFYLGAYWKERQRTLREYIADTKRFLARLGELHPVFQGLVLTGRTPSSGVRLLPDLSNVEELLFRLAPRTDVLFTHAHPDGSPTLSSECDIGFLTSYSNAEPRVEEKVSITLTAGASSPSVSNAVVLYLPMGVSEFREYAFVRRLLETVVDCWAPSTAVVSSTAFRKKLGGPGGSHTIGWMTWFADPTVREALPKEIEVEPLDGGLLVTTTREVISPDAPDHVATAIKVRESLKEHGLLR